MSATGIGLWLWSGGLGFLAYRAYRTSRRRYSTYMDRYIATMETRLRASDVFVAPDQFLRLSWMAAGLSGLAGVLLFFNAPLPLLLLAGFGLGALGFAAPRIVFAWLARRRLARFEEQLPDGVDLLSKSMRAGLSIAAAFEVGSKELPQPCAQEFAIVVRDTQNNRSLAEAVERMAQRMTLEDTRLLSIVVDLGSREGGDMTGALNAVATTMRNRFNVRRKVRAATAAARAQLSVIATMPFVMLGLFTLTNPELMRPLWSTRIGWILLGVVIVLEAVGILVMTKIARSVEY